MTFYIDLNDNRNIIVKEKLTKENSKIEFTPNKENGDVLIFAPNKKFEIKEIESFRNNAILFCGNCNFEDVIKKKNIKHFNALKDEKFSILNSNLTAEGILEKIISETDYSIFDLKYLILGSGRVGKATAELFSRLNLDFSMVSHSEENFALDYIFCKKNYFKNEFIKKINNFNVIINTIPAKILNSKQIAQIDKNCLFLEISSVQTIESCQFKYVLCPALPQKFSHKTAGEIYFQFIKKMLKNTP